MVRSYVRAANGSVRWQAVWRDVDGKQRSKNFDDEASAIAHEKQMVQERIAALPPLICAREECGEPVPRFTAKGHKQRIYHSDECERLVANSTAARIKRRQRLENPTPLRPPAVCKLAECENLVPQNPLGRPGEFCSLKHGSIYHNRLIAQAKGPNARHMITNANETTNRGDCSVCGHDVPIWSYMDRSVDGAPRKRFRCQAKGAIGRVESSRRYDRSRLGFAAKLRNNYGLEIEEWDALMVFQVGRCARCTRPMYEPHVDHDHSTKRVRGLLCSTCNTGIGKLDDSIEGVRAALDYLENPPADVVLSTQAQRPNPGQE